MGLWHALEYFAVESEVGEMKMSISKSEAMVPFGNSVGCFLQVMGENLPLVEQFSSFSRDLILE